MSLMHTGSCLCGAVRFSVEGEVHAPDACHCSQCRKQSGHYWASSGAPRSAVTIEGEERLTWYQSSEKARRGFCATCGSFLFWQPLEKDSISFAMGALERPTDLKLALHIFVADKGDYYEIKDGLPQNQQ
jgi:hypothetical protein